MKKKILVGSILAAVLIILLPISSVVGTNIVKTNAEKRMASPLFAKRVNSIIKKDTNKINTNYIGKGRVINIFLTKKTSLDKWIDKAMKIINTRPKIFNNLLDKLDTIPGIVNTLKENNVDINEFKNHINLIKNNPDLLKKDIDEAVQMAGSSLELSINDPEPLGGFSGQPGCLIAFLVVFPIILMIGTMIATFTIFTCLNLNGCFEKILQNIFEGLSQSLIPGV